MTPHAPSAPPLPAVLLGALLLCSALPASAQRSDDLLDLLNDYRSRPQRCDGRRLAPAAPLDHVAALSRVRGARGVSLERAVKDSGVAVARVEVISLSGSTDPEAVMDAIVRDYCRTLLDPDYALVGIRYATADWHIVLAEPARTARYDDERERDAQAYDERDRDERAGPRTGDRVAPRAPDTRRQQERRADPDADWDRPATPALDARRAESRQPAAGADRLPGPTDAGKRILAAVNAARATARKCGPTTFAAVPALAWNAKLAAAAQAHSDDMARNNFFDHAGKDGRQASARATQAGYGWRSVGENIAKGQESPEAAVKSWVASAGHCANLMSGQYKDMGAAYALGRGGEPGAIYWTQVFGASR